VAARLADARWPDIPDGGLVLVPLGATEQHGPHLPLNTDTVIAEALADHAAAALPEPAFVAPAVPYGASGEHAGFPGTVSLGHQALHALIVETVRSLALWAGRIVFVNGHGGNTATLDTAITQLRREGHDTAWAACAIPAGDAHAGRTETSLMLHLAPDQVRMDHAAPGNPRPLAEILPQLRAGGVASVSPTGVLGDPTGAHPAEGRLTLERAAADIARSIDAWRVDTRGRLLP
jgi:creatinine amidohydrolase